MAIRRTGCRAGHVSSEVDCWAESGVAQAQTAAATMTGRLSKRGTDRSSRIDISPCCSCAVAPGSKLFAEALRCLDHDRQLLRCKRPADGHEAAVGRQPDLVGGEVFEHAGDAALHGIDGWCGAVAGVD